MSCKRIFFFLGLSLWIAFTGCTSDEEKKMEFLETGKAYFEKGEYKNAEIELRNALQIDPRFVEAHRYLAETYMKLGDAKGAFQEYVRLEQLEVDDPEIQRKLATIYFLGKRYDEARQRIESVLARNPDDIDMLFLLAGVLEQEKDYDQAVETYEKIISLDENQARAYLALSRLLAFQEKYGKAEERLKQAIAIEPESLRPQLALFHLYAASAAHDQAEQQIRKLIETTPDDINLYILRGSYYMENDQIPEAEEAYQEAAAVDPENVKPYMALAALYDTTGNAEKSLEMYQKALELQPDEIGILHPIARYHFNAKAFDEAETYINRILEKNDKYFPTRMLKGELMVIQRNFDDAIALFDQLISEEPGAERAHYFKGVAYLGKGEAHLARMDLVRAVELNPDYLKARLLLAEIYLREQDYLHAQEESQAVLAATPDNDQARLILGNSYLYQERPAAAEAEFKKLIARKPDNPVGYYRLGLVYRMQGQNEPAMENFNIALDKNPRLMDVFVSKVSLLAANRQFEKALQACDRQLELVAESDASSALIHSLKGGLYMNQRKLEQAEASFQKALELNPGFMRPYYALAQINLMENKADKAVEQYQTLLEKDPKKVAPHMLLGTIYDMQKKHDLSEQHYRKALEIEPEFAPAANNLAYLLADQERNLNEALDLAQKAKRLLPGDANVMDTLGWVYFKKGLYPSAIREFTDSVSKNPDNPTIRYHLGLAYYQNDEKEVAKEHLEAALRLNETFDGADRARQLLAEM